MSSQISIQRDAFTANGTSEWFLSGVNSQVSGQSASVAESHITNGARERFLSGVDSDVCGQI